MAKYFPRLAKDETGAVTVEFVIVIPLLLTMMILSFEVFDAFKSYSRASKATYAVSDIITRQTQIDQTFVQELHLVMDSMMPWLNEDKWIRVTTISYDSVDGYQVVWSYGSGTTDLWTDQTMTEALIGKLPTVASGDTIVVTETSIPHRSLVQSLGLDDMVWSVKQIARPRFVTCITDTVDACGALNEVAGSASAPSNDPSEG